MIEVGEPLHLYGGIFLSLAISFMIGTVYGNVSRESENAQKNND